jgi:tetratricopeptide (TPR) repeat protein
MDYLERSKVDKNVMAYEMVNFVNDQTELSALYRYGGDIQLLKSFIASGFPIVIEKGYYEWSSISGSVAWMGHYLFITGYDDAEGVFVVQDAYLTPGEDLRVPYDEFIIEWRYFNYVFIVVYPPERETQVIDILGSWSDWDWANQHALDIANDEISRLEGLDLYFAWFNKGTSHVQLYQYVDAAFAYDYAFLLYEGLTEEERPFRMMWYQTGPYFAYYYSERYQDVINLANTTLYETIKEPTLEESFYWRGMARLAIGEIDNAISDFRQSVYLNPNFTPGWEMLESLGVGP